MKEFRQDALRETGAFFVAHKPFIHWPAQSRGKKRILFLSQEILYQKIYQKSSKLLFLNKFFVFENADNNLLF